MLIGGPAMDTRKRLPLEAPVGPTILRIEVPNLAVTVVQASIGLTQTYFVAKLGLDALVSMALALPPFMLLQMVSVVRP
jgi:Na+-driven multidrug efflux pump